MIDNFKEEDKRKKIDEILNNVSISDIISRLLSGHIGLEYILYSAIGNILASNQRHLIYDRFLDKLLSLYPRFLPRTKFVVFLLPAETIVANVGESTVDRHEERYEVIVPPYRDVIEKAAIRLRPKKR